VTGEPRNAASDWLRDEAPRWADPDYFGQEFPRLLSDDFIAVDRHHLTGAASADAGEYFERQKIWHDLGYGRVTVEVTEVVAVRGDRAMLVLMRVAFENGFVLEALNVFRSDASVTRLERAVAFDPEDLDVALAELDAMHDSLEAH
jgi:hypothetical protein